MSTIEANPTTVKTRRITAVIHGDVHDVEPMETTSPSVVGFRLTSRVDGSTQEVHQGAERFTYCSCPAWHMDSPDTGGICPHTQALVDAGLIAPTPDDDAPAETDDAPLPFDGPRLTLSEALEAIRDDYRSLDSDLGDLLAQTVGELISECRITGARDVATLLDRRAALAS